MVVMVLILAGLLVLGAAVAVALGRGGELAATQPNRPRLPDTTTPSRLPRALWGYQVDVADEAILRLNHALYERETEVRLLEDRLAEMRQRLKDSEASADARWSPSEGADPVSGEGPVLGPEAPWARPGTDDPPPDQPASMDRPASLDKKARS